MVKTVFDARDRDPFLARERIAPSAIGFRTNQVLGDARG